MQLHSTFKTWNIEPVVLKDKLLQDQSILTILNNYVDPIKGGVDILFYCG